MHQCALGTSYLLLCPMCRHRMDMRTGVIDAVEPGGGTGPPETGGSAGMSQPN